MNWPNCIIILSIPSMLKDKGIRIKICQISCVVCTVQSEARGAVSWSQETMTNLSRERIICEVAHISTVSEELKTVLSTTSLQIFWIKRLLENYLTICLFKSEDPGLWIAGN